MKQEVTSRQSLRALKEAFSFLNKTTLKSQCLSLTGTKESTNGLARLRQELKITLIFGMSPGQSPKGTESG